MYIYIYIIYPLCIYKSCASVAILAQVCSSLLATFPRPRPVLFDSGAKFDPAMLRIVIATILFCGALGDYNSRDRLNALIAKGNGQPKVPCKEICSQLFGTTRYRSPWRGSGGKATTTCKCDRIAEVKVTCGRTGRGSRPTPLLPPRGLGGRGRPNREGHRRRGARGGGAARTVRATAAAAGGPGGWLIEAGIHEITIQKPNRLYTDPTY